MDVVFPVRELNFVGPVIPTLYKLIDVTKETIAEMIKVCLLYTSPSPRDRTRSRMPSSA